MDHSAGLTGKTSLEKINIVSAKKQLLLKKPKKRTIRKMQVYHLLLDSFNGNHSILATAVHVIFFGNTFHT